MESEVASVEVLRPAPVKTPLFPPLLNATPTAAPLSVFVSDMHTRQVEKHSLDSSAVVCEYTVLLKDENLPRREVPRHVFGIRLEHID